MKLVRSVTTMMAMMVCCVVSVAGPVATQAPVPDPMFTPGAAFDLSPLCQGILDDINTLQATIASLQADIAQYDADIEQWQTDILAALYDPALTEQERIDTILALQDQIDIYTNLRNTKASLLAIAQSSLAQKQQDWINGGCDIENP